MRTTFTLATRPARIANGGDFVALGHGVYKTDWQHFQIDFEVIDDRQIIIDRIIDISGEPIEGRFASFGDFTQQIIERHCRAYANLIARLSPPPRSPA